MKAVGALYLNRQFGKFLLAGGLAALLNFASRFVFQTFMAYWPSVAAAYGVGFVTAYLLNRRFVFPNSGKPVRQELAWFFLFNALAFPVVIAVSLGLSRLFGVVAPEALAEAAAHGIAILLPAFVNFAAHKFITFGQRAKAD